MSATATQGELTLFADYGCPFSQRLQAVLLLLEVDFHCEVVELPPRSEALLRHSPTGRLPLLQLGERAVYESSVIAEYLCERFGWSDAFPVAPEGRARHRMAIRRLESAWRATMGPGGLRDELSSQRIDEDLDHLQETLELYPHPGPGLLVFSAVPFWQRWVWTAPRTDMPDRIRSRPALEAWFQAGQRLPSLQATQPDLSILRQLHSHVPSHA